MNKRDVLDEESLTLGATRMYKEPKKAYTVFIVTKPILALDCHFNVHKSTNLQNLGAETYPDSVSLL
jgi:GMP synthase-like glutamine amidotransferase